MFCTALEFGRSKDFNWKSGFKQEAELYLSKFKWGSSFITLNHTMLDVYAACQGDSSTVVAAQNKYLEEARLEKESRYRGKYNRNRVFCQVWWLSIITWFFPDSFQSVSGSWLLTHVSSAVMTFQTKNFPSVSEAIHKHFSFYSWVNSQRINLAKTPHFQIFGYWSDMSYSFSHYSDIPCYVMFLRYSFTIFTERRMPIMPVAFSRCLSTFKMDMLKHYVLGVTLLVSQLMHTHFSVFQDITKWTHHINTLIEDHEWQRQGSAR